MKNFIVVGSINMDLVSLVPRLPQKGETILATSFSTLPGGKGANQAVALARLSNEVVMVAKIGRDAWGEQYTSILEKERVSTEFVAQVPDCTTGIAIVEVDAHSNNRIVVVPGANFTLDAPYVKSCLNTIMKTYETTTPIFFLLQLEVPLEIVRYTLTLIDSYRSTYPHITVIVDPAPAQQLPPAMYTSIDYITPNETETRILTGVAPRSQEEFFAAGKMLLEYGCRNVIIKAGEKGAYHIDDTGIFHVPASSGVHPKDTTAAGDVFNAGLAHALCAQLPAIQAIEFANRVAGVSTAKLGAQSAMPYLSDLV